ncbi:MAG TPA: YaeQ family protein, partial [Steroidobacteraceae bacterium]|nr:YaeQ family protein [Steroidobacteraceae bacterium]
MALGATIYTFDIDLADSDRAVYQSLNLRVAQHPSETPDYLLTRVLAYCLVYAEGIAFSKGLSDPDQPAISVCDLTGALQVWVDIGLPEPERLHRASKAAPRVAVYTHKD